MIALLRIPILIFFITTSFVAVGQTSNLVFDTSTTAIITYNQKMGWPFDSTYKTTTLTQQELQSIDSFLLVCIADFNNSLGKDYKWWSINLKQRDYKKQLVAVLNEKGQKEVFVNCFCHDFGDKWEINILEVDDGGNCYFHFKINLMLKMYFSLSVNGVA
jgi:hypothetical protein